MIEIICPKCGNDLDDEETMMDLCGEPYNGIVVECDCGCELDLTLSVHVEVIKNENSN